MKFGINTFVWVSPCTTEAIRDLAPKVRSMGYDILEISVENPALIDVAEVKEILAQNQLETVMCGAFGPDRNLCSTNPEYRENARRYILWLIDAAAELGANTVAGPMYSSVGKDHLEDPAERQAEWQRAVAGVQELAAYAQEKNVRLALEALNRFETDMINIVDQGLRFADETGMQNVGLHLDTFHMHLEEKNSASAIRKAGNRIYHFHACENDRGIPGTGQVRWTEIGRALRDVNYPGPVVIESFTDQVKEIARAVCIWREIAPSQDAIATQGLNFLRNLLVSETPS
jgi:D-psicose/D-tagatose/L-ribulose 3-epimerase